jgi:hypothetical protein
MLFLVVIVKGIHLVGHLTKPTSILLKSFLIKTGLWLIFICLPFSGMTFVLLRRSVSSLDFSQRQIQ